MIRRNRDPCRRLARAALLIAVCALPALAAAPAGAIDIPRPAEADSIDKRLQPAPPPLLPSLPAPPQTPRTAPPGAEELHFVLQAVDIEGAHSYGPNAWQPLYQSLIGQDVTLARIYDLADQIRQRYFADGCVLTQVFLPPQEIAGGRVRIRVVEGYVSRVRWTGDRLDSALAQEIVAPLTTARPFTGQRLEAVMLRLNSLPGLHATATLEPLPAPEAEEGAAGLVLDVTRQRVAATAGIDDFASRYLGTWESNGHVEGNGLLRPTDQLGLTAMKSVTPGAFDHGDFRYALPVDASGTTLTLAASRTQTRPGYRLEALDIASTADSVSFGVEQPLALSRQESVQLKGHLNMHQEETDVLRTRFSDDRQRTADLSLCYSFADGWSGVNRFEPGLEQGLDILGANSPGSQHLSRASGRSDFTKFTFNASRLQGLGGGMSLLLAATGQRASAPLLSSEQFGYGGPGFGRAYDSSEITGDHGIAASAELRYDGLSGARWQVQPYAFCDRGEVWDRGPHAQIASAASAGGGVRLAWAPVSAGVEIAWPLIRRPSTPRLGETDGARLGLSLTVSY